jgi:Flp pilus assembly protein TadB
MGLWALAVWLVPPRPALGELVDRLSEPSVALDITGDDGELGPTQAEAMAGWAARIGGPFVSALRALGLPGTALRRDLTVLGRDPAVHLAEKAALALTGLVAPAVCHLILVVAGVSLTIEVPLLLGVALASGGFVLPDMNVRTAAKTRRREFRHALSAYLDLVWIALAGGAGVDSAIDGAARVSDSWEFTQIRRALEHARLTRTTPWTGLRRLGERLDVVELAELSASVSLAGTQGARVRASLAAKADSLREHRLSEAEADAQAATERMALPVGLLFLGFLVFIAFPAVVQVMAGI